MNWRKRSHKLFLDHIRKGTDYRFKNKYDDPRFDQCNKSIIRYVETLNTVNDITLSDFQLDLSKHTFDHVVQIMFKEFWNEYNTTIMKLYNMKEEDIIARVIACGTGRRQGKSTWFISTIVSVLVSMHTDFGPFGFDFKMAVVAHREDTAIALLNYVKEGLKHSKYLSEFTIYSNKNVIQLTRIKGKGQCEISAWATGSVS